MIEPTYGANRLSWGDGAHAPAFTDEPHSRGYGLRMVPDQPVKGQPGMEPGLGVSHGPGRKGK